MAHFVEIKNYSGSHLFIGPRKNVEKRKTYAEALMSKKTYAAALKTNLTPEIIEIKKLTLPFFSSTHSYFLEKKHYSEPKSTRDSKKIKPLESLKFRVSRFHSRQSDLDRKLLTFEMFPYHAE